MKLTQHLLRRAMQLGFSLALVQPFTGLATDAAPLTAPAPAATTAQQPAMTHTLFMGADIDVLLAKEFLRVEDVSPDWLLVRKGGKPLRLPIAECSELRINETLRLSGTSVVVGSVEAERAYTLAGDPFRQVVQGTAMQAGAEAAVDLARYQELQVNMMLETPLSPGETSMLPQLKAEAAASTAIVVQKSAHEYNNGSSLATGAKEGNYDAIRLSFELQPPCDLDHPSYAIIVQIRDPGSQPGRARKWAYLKALPPLSAGETRKVRVFQGGMIPGYEIEGTEVHLYNRGVELATTLSRKRVALTDDEALDYQTIEYISDNKGRTLPAAPLRITLSKTQRAALSPLLLREPCFVKVGKDGHVKASFSDAAGKEPTSDPTLQAALLTLRFKPALQAGKPVESIIPLALTPLATP